MDEGFQNSPKKKIHFILPSGGIRGAFGGGFIYCLRKKYSEYFDIARIDGTSAGALNGLALLFRDPEDIRESWLSITSIDQLFNPWSATEVLNKIKTIYNAYYNKSVRGNDGLRNHIETHFQKVNTEFLPKYNCTVVNVLNARVEYINGTHPNLTEFVLASASPWILSPSVVIDGVSYTDGGLLATYPTDHIEAVKNGNEETICIIVGYDPIHHSSIGMPGHNMFVYMSRLIDILRHNHSNIAGLDDLIKKHNIVVVENTMRCPFNQLDPQMVEKGFIDGILAAQKFAREYLIPKTD